MKRRKIICPEERLKQLEDNFVKETQEWEYIHEYGCQDPFWPDGTNLNLIRNHCIYFIEQIKNLCAEHSLPLPMCCHSLPAEVDDNYMAPHGRFPDRLLDRKCQYIDEPPEPVQMCLEFSAAPHEE